jgi:hypothetical protein
MSDIDVSMPPNMSEFNQLTAIIFTKLYIAFPLVGEIEGEEVARTLGLDSVDSTLPSGRKFDEVLRATFDWLANEGYIRGGPFNLTKTWRGQLTDKGRKTMNVDVPTLGSAGNALVANTRPDVVSTAQGRTVLVEVVKKIFG